MYDAMHACEATFKVVNGVYGVMAKAMCERDYSTVAQCNEFVRELFDLNIHTCDGATLRMLNKAETYKVRRLCLVMWCRVVRCCAV